MLKILPDFPDHVLGVSALGRVSASDYRTVLEPAVTRAMMQKRPLDFFYHLGPAFEQMEPGAFWEDGKLGLMHWRDWGRIAVVTDVGWIAGAVNLFGPLFHHPVRVFAEKDYEAARRWIAAPESQAAA